MSRECKWAGADGVAVFTATEMMSLRQPVNPLVRPDRVRQLCVGMSSRKARITLDPGRHPAVRPDENGDQHPHDDDASRGEAADRRASRC
jgi:hypothetical protein